jgi:hypothetical protein
MNDEKKNDNNELINLLPSNIINEIDSSFFENDEGEEIEKVKLFIYFFYFRVLIL